MINSPLCCLSIGGTDPSGSAGMSADLKTFWALGAHGCFVPSLITIQTTAGVEDVHFLPGQLVASQLAALFSDLTINAAKCGALGDAANVQAIVSALPQKKFPLVIDPIIRSSNGKRLLTERGLELMKTELFPRAALVTPNLDEAAELAGFPVTGLDSMRRAAEAIAGYGVPNVLIKGGHLADSATDVLLDPSGTHLLRAERLTDSPVRGTGCVLSAAITFHLASGNSVLEAVTSAKDFITSEISRAQKIGQGSKILSLIPL